MRRPRPSSRACPRLRFAAVAALTMALTACAGDGLSVRTSSDDIVPTSPEETDVADTAASDSTSADTAPDDTKPPTFTFPKPTLPTATSELPDVTAAVVTAPPATTPATAPPVAPVTPPDQPYTFVEVFDDTGLISASLPSAWTDIDGASLVFGDDGESAPVLEASPNLERYRSHWDTPGMRFTASASLAGADPTTLIDVRRPSDCDTDGPQAYDDGVFAGEVEVFTNCGGTGSSLYVIGATNEAGDVGVIVSVQTVTADDVAAFDEIQRTFNIHS